MRSNISNFVSKAIVALAIIALTTFSTQTFAQANKAPKDKVMDKKVYTIDLIIQGKKNPKAVPDEIGFMNNKLKSKAMGEFGFSSPVAYTVTTDSSGTDVTITIEAEGKNSDEESLKWTGTITGEAIEGTTVITTKKGKVKKEFTYSGTLKVKVKK